jgi:hypothetical protein
MDELFKKFQEEALPKIKDSAGTVIILNRTVDAKICLEVGASILLDKYLVVVTDNFLNIPHKLDRLADDIVLVENMKKLTDEEYKKIQNAIGKLVDWKNMEES